jgi:hypothetical protein
MCITLNYITFKLISRLKYFFDYQLSIFIVNFNYKSEENARNKNARK